MGYERRRVVQIGNEVAVVLSAAEARALRAIPGGEVDAFIAPGAVELSAVDRYAEMSDAELWAIIKGDQIRR